MSKLKKALKVAKDLDTLDFVMKSSPSKPYTLTHPEGKYSVWIANGFWFVALWEIDGELIYHTNSISKFGAIGKCIVWWKYQKHIRKWCAEKKDVEMRIISSIYK